MKGIFRQIQFLANVSTIVIALLLAIIVIKQTFLQPEDAKTVVEKEGNASARPDSKPLAATPVGKLVPLENVNWKENKTTLILYLSTTCKYCKESSPFYQRLVRDPSNKDVKIVAVFSQPLEDAKEYLKTHDLAIPQVYNDSFASIGVTATPTLLLVDENGVVQNHWRGRLQAEKENEVLAKLSS